MKNRPRFYSGKLAAGEFLFRFTQQGQTFATMEPILSEIEGAADAPWCAVFLLSALGEKHINMLPPAMGERLLALVRRASQENKPTWAELPKGAA